MNRRRFLALAAFAPAAVRGAITGLGSIRPAMPRQLVYGKTIVPLADIGDAYLHPSVEDFHAMADMYEQVRQDVLDVLSCRVVVVPGISGGDQEREPWEDDPNFGSPPWAVATHAIS